jgi:hypothetical protein
MKSPPSLRFKHCALFQMNSSVEAPGRFMAEIKMLIILTAYQGVVSAYIGHVISGVFGRERVIRMAGTSGRLIDRTSFLPISQGQRNR